MAEFASRDPNAPGFWDERFERGFTPWDMGGVPLAVRHFVEQSKRPLHTLIPGCGSAYELAFLSDAGWEATAIDFSPAAVTAGKAAVGKWSERVEQADFFSWEPTRTLDLIYERAFLCAMQRAHWERVAQRWSALLPTGGRLAGFFFFDDVPKGPPFGISRARLDELMAGAFICVEDAAVTDSMPVFDGKERWMVWERC